MTNKPTNHSHGAESFLRN